jgi:hypothetical protein
MHSFVISPLRKSEQRETVKHIHIYQGFGEETWGKETTWKTVIERTLLFLPLLDDSHFRGFIKQLNNNEVYRKFRFSPEVISFWNPTCDLLQQIAYPCVATAREGSQGHDRSRFFEKSQRLTPLQTVASRCSSDADSQRDSSSRPNPASLGTLKNSSSLILKCDTMSLLIAKDWLLN